MRFLIVTGMSGAGKTQALRVLEDAGYYCVDNLPPMLMPPFLDLCRTSAATATDIAVGVDLRGGAFFEAVDFALEALEERGIESEVVFLDATDEALILRFQETRRPHPLGADRRLIDCIAEERERLQPLRHVAKHVINTTGMSTRELRQRVLSMFTDAPPFLGLNVSVLSFGFKRGIPLEADLVFDVRFLSNPFHNLELRPHSGLDAVVREYVLGLPETAVFLDKLIDMLQYVLPLYVREGKNQVVLAIGCTGGVHRSVTLAERIGDLLKEAGYHVKVDHRDLRRERDTHELLRRD